MNYDVTSFLDKDGNSILYNRFGSKRLVQFNTFKKLDDDKVMIGAVFHYPGHNVGANAILEVSCGNGQLVDKNVSVKSVLDFQKQLEDQYSLECTGAEKRPVLAPFVRELMTKQGIAERSLLSAHIAAGAQALADDICRGKEEKVVSQKEPSVSKKKDVAFIPLKLVDEVKARDGKLVGFVLHDKNNTFVPVKAEGISARRLTSAKFKKLLLVEVEPSASFSVTAKNIKDFAMEIRSWGKRTNRQTKDNGKEVDGHGRL